LSVRSSSRTSGVTGGIADEGEANFTAWLSCAGGSPPNAYSGWLFLYGELARA
jgi:hypothetical protein